MLPAFGRYFFPHIIRGTDEVPECHAGLIRELSSAKSSAIIFPRHFAKTTWEKIDTIHDIVYGLEPVILYVGATLRDGQFHFESIKGELENNELLRSVYGNLVPDPKNLGRKWTNTHFETLNRVNVVARTRAKGRGVNIRNQRPTKIILDDIEDDETVRNADLRKKLDHWIFGVIVQSRDKQHGRVKMIGTILHPESSLVKFHKTFGGIKRAAIEDGASIWPEMWPLSSLEEERGKIGTLLFNQEYMNQPITAAERMVSEETLRKVPRPARESLDMYGAIDPAISEKQTADYTAIVSAGRRTDSGKIVVWAVERGHLAFPEQVRTVLRRHVQYQYLLFGVETVAYQRALKQELDRVSAIDGTYVPTSELTVDTDKVRRFLHVLPFIENGTIQFCDDLPDEFFAELLEFPNGVHDDMVDAFVHAATLAIESSAMPEVIRLV